MACVFCFKNQLSYAASYWAKLHSPELPRTLMNCFILLSYCTLLWATLHSPELCCTLLSYAAFYWAMLHHNELRCTLLNYAVPSELRCIHQLAGNYDTHRVFDYIHSFLFHIPSAPPLKIKAKLSGSSPYPSTTLTNSLFGTNLVIVEHDELCAAVANLLLIVSAAGRSPTAAWRSPTAITPAANARRQVGAYWATAGRRRLSAGRRLGSRDPCRHWRAGMAAGMKTAGSWLSGRRTDSVTGQVGWRGRLGGHRFCKRKYRRSIKVVVKLDFRRTCKQCFEDSET